MIGTIGIVKIENNKLFIGYVLNEKFHNRGLMTKIIKYFLEIIQIKYKTYDIYAEVIDGNFQSLKVLKKNNFAIMGDIMIERQNQQVKGKLLKFNNMIVNFDV